MQEPASPLPWKVADESATWATVEYANGQGLIEFDGWVSVADARYIVTAANAFPELVSALGSLASAFEKRLGEYELDPPVLSHALAVIAKAEGR